MGYQELVESLRKEGEDKIQSMKNEVEAEAEKIREEISKKTRQLREEYRKRQAGVIREQEEDVLLETAKKARIIKLSAEKSLSDRLFLLAISCLYELRNKRYSDVFESLVKELPTFKWKDVRVNPEDVRIAQKYLPDSTIIPDDDISGGLEVVTEEGRIRILNTFEKRLEKAWGDLIPLFIREIYKEISDYGTHSNS